MQETNAPDSSLTQHRASGERRTWLISTASGRALQFETRISKHFPADQLIRTRSRIDITKWAPSLPDKGLVIIVGGDGAWREVLQCAPEQVTPGLLPAGSLNQAAIELNTTASVSAWQSLRRNRIQLGHVRGSCGADTDQTIFFLMAGIGVESDAAQRVRRKLKRWIGKWAYVCALLERLLHPVNKTIVVGIHGRHFRTSQVLIQNGAHYGGRYPVAHTDIFTPDYHVLIWKYSGRFMWCLTMMCLMFRLPSGWLAHQLPARHVRIRSLDSKQCQLDGDTGPALPLRISPTTMREIAISGRTGV